MDALDADAVAQELVDLPLWTGGVDGITRTVAMPSFPEVIALVDRIAVAAEEADHHPDIDIRWRTVVLRLLTYVAGGRVTTYDISMAHRIDEIIAEAS
jgi:4a-hydroxytetrahydrobiopterin dehydratase